MMTYYYDEKTKTNRLDCHYPVIDEKAIKELVENSLSNYVYIYIYNENNVIVNHWSYEVKHGGFHTYENLEIETKKRIKKHVATLKRYIEESYTEYIVNAEKITQEKIRYELKNHFNINPGTVDEMPDWKATAIWKQGPEKYQEYLEEEEEYRMQEYDRKIRSERAKSYKEYNKIYIGGSDYASLVLVGITKKGLEAKILNFGEDGDYNAYFVDKDAKIGSHYKKQYEFQRWLKIYDDNELVKTIYANKIEIYQAGQFGCIIRKE